MRNWGWLPGALTPPLQAHLSRLGSRLSFAEAAQELWHLKGVRVSAAMARRRTEADGRVYVAAQDQQAMHVRALMPVPLLGPAVQQVSVDGAMLPPIDGSWREVRTLAIGTVVPGREAGRVRCAEVSYFSRLADAATFTVLATGEMHRRGVETSGVVAGLSDGAEWCQQFLDVHRPDAVRMLDFLHAAQRLNDVADAVWGTGEVNEASAAERRAGLRGGDLTTVLAAIRPMPLDASPAPPQAARVQATVLGYLTPRLAQMRYAAFRAQGLPNGSGVVESANKLVVEARLKGAGRRWAEGNVTPMVALRGALCSDHRVEDLMTIARARRDRQLPAPIIQPPMASATSVAAPARRPRQPAVPDLHQVGPCRIVNGRPTTAHP